MSEAKLAAAQGSAGFRTVAHYLPEVYRVSSESPGAVVVIAVGDGVNIVARVAQDRRYRARLDVGYQRPFRAPIWTERNIYCDGWEGRVAQLVKSVSQVLPNNQAE